VLDSLLGQVSLKYFKKRVLIQSEIVEETCIDTKAHVIGLQRWAVA